MTIEAFRLSPQQRRTWTRAGDAPGVLRARCELALSGALDEERLAAALQRLVAKHEILRSAFELHAASGAGAQFIHESADVALVTRDLSGQPESAWRALAEACVPERGDANHPPRPAAVLARRAEQRWSLALGLPAEAADRRGLENLVAELARAYDGSLQSEAMQYADVAEWQNELLEAEESAPGLAHWRAAPVAAGLALELPFQGTAAAGGTPAYAPGTQHHSLGDDVAAALGRTASALGATPTDVLFAAWNALLFRLSRSRSVASGLAFDGRRYAELADCIGPLARTPPVPLEVAPTASFRSLVRAVATARADAERWVECYSAEDLPGAPPWLPFAFEHARLAAPRTADGVTFELTRADARAEPATCRLLCHEHAGALELTLDYDTNCFAAATIERLAGQFAALLRSALEDPGRTVGRLDALAAEERQRIVVDFNDTRTEYDRERCAHDWIEEQALRTPDAIAVRYEETELTYAELERRANRLAHHLLERGVGPDVLVALCVERSVDMVVAIVAILKAGGAYVPVDPAYPKDRLGFLLEDTQAPVLVTQAKFVPELPETGAALVQVDADSEAIARHPDTKPDSGVRPEHLVYVIYTSGSTGKPKGVVITHEKLVISNSARVSAFGHTPEKFLLLSSFAFDSSVVGIFWTLCGGGTLLLIPEALQKDIARIPKIIAAEGVSHLLTLPSFYQHLIEQAAPEDLGGMRASIVAGEACPLGMVEKHRTRLPGVGLFSEYGATETTVFSSVYDCLEQTLGIAPVGDPIDNAEMWVLDEDLEPCPTGVPGEVHFGGIALALGYWRRPALTAERFIPHPHAPYSSERGARLYKSGDLARHLETGDLEFLGRLDNQVKIRGFRIELEEIEIALALHPAIKETAVLALTDLSAEKRLVAYLVPEVAGKSPSVGEMREFLAETLPDYMVPGVFVSLPDFPRTPNGKVDRKALPEPGSERPELESEYRAPESPAETQLAQIWCDVLGLASVGVNDNFFELGGDSILSIQIVSRAKQAGIQLTPRLVFEHQTVATLAAAAQVDDAALSSASATIDAEQGQVTGPVALTPVQRWFVELDLPAPSHWNMPVLLRTRRPLAQESLERALGELLAHHDALRLRLRRDPAASGGWAQEIAPHDADAARGLVAHEDLSRVPQHERAAARQAALERHQTSLDLERGPLTRFVILDHGDDGQELLWILHHLGADGVSWRILLEDLETLLDAQERGASAQLPAKTTSFQRWAQGLVEYAAAPERAAEVARWAALADAAQPVLPVDHAAQNGAPSNGREDSARRVTLAIDAETTRALLSQVPAAAGTQIHEVLLAAFVQAVAQWTGEPDVLVNLEGHGREEVLAGVDLSRTVGWFTTDVPVRLSATLPLDAGTTLRAVADAARGAAEQALAFGVLRYLAPAPEVAAAMGRVPTPELGFNYLGQFDQVLADGSRFAFSPELPSGAHDPSGPRAFLLEAYGMVADGVLTMHFEYSAARHERATIEALARGFEEALRALIEHALAHAEATPASLEPDDFAWSATDLEAIAGAIQEAQAAAEEPDE